MSGEEAPRDQAIEIATPSRREYRVDLAEWCTRVTWLWCRSELVAPSAAEPRLMRCGE